MNEAQVMHAMSIDDAYKVERVLAHGANGVTELVTIDGAGPFVRKKIPLELARRAVWLALADCDCVRLPQVMATYELPDAFVVVYGFVPGESLERRVSRDGALSGPEAWRLGRELCEASGALHAHGIVHRDITPANILVSSDGAHLVDLGIARMKVEGASRDTNSLGTWGYASPEQYGFAQTDARSDVYSIGRVLAYALTGIQPDDKDFDEVEAALPADERAVIARACAFEPSSRYQSTAELAAALGDGSDGLAAPPAGKASGSRGEAVGGVAAEQKRPDGGVETSASGAKKRSGVSRALLAAAVAAALAAAAIGVFVAARSSGLVGGEAGAEAPVAEQPATANEPAREPSASGSTSAAQPLEVTESGWSVADGGLVSYAFCLRNNAAAQVDLPGVTITGRDENGAVVFTEDQYLLGICAGESTYYGGIAGNGTVPATVEFAPIEPKGPSASGHVGDLPAYAVKDVRAVADGLGGVNFVGEVATQKAGDSSGTGQVAVTVILRDESGAIVYGTTGFATPAPEGQSANFEVMGIDAPSNYETLEAYAQPW